MGNNFLTRYEQNTHQEETDQSEGKVSHYRVGALGYKVSAVHQPHTWKGQAADRVVLTASNSPGHACRVAPW